MKKFDLKKFIAENKATFYSSLNENESTYEAKKSKKYYKDAEADDAEHIKALEKDMKDDKKASKMKVSELKSKIKEMVLSEMNLDVDNMEDAPESEVDFLTELEGMLKMGSKFDEEGYEGSDDHFQDTIDESGLWPALMKFKDEGFSLEHVVGWIEANWYMINEAEANKFDTNKPARIKEFIIALNRLVDEYHAELYLNNDLFDAISMVIKYAQEEARNINEADEKAADEEAAADVTVDDTETTDVETTAEVDPNVKAVQDSLTQAQAAAQALGDKKLLDQIGNTITFFTRTHVVEKPGATV